MIIVGDLDCTRLSFYFQSVTFIKRVVPKGRYHTLDAINISLYVCGGGQ